jgi:hypothetical protein
MKSDESINRRYIYVVVLFTATLLLAFSVTSLFFFDEDIFVVNSNGDFFKQIWQRGFVCKLTYLSDNYFFGKNPAGYHIVNLLFHLADAVLGTLVLKEFIKLCHNHFTGFQVKIIPVIFFILFLVSPIHSEPLCYILARDGSMVTFFSLLSVLFFMKVDFKNNGWFFFSLLFFLCALFTYEISWMLPVIILSIAVFKGYIKKQPLKKNIAVPALYFIFFAAWFIIKVVLTDKFEVSDYRNQDLFSISFLTLLKNIDLLFLRNFIPPFKSTAIFLFISAFFIIALAAGLYKIFREKRPLFFLCILLVALTLFGFLAVAIIGIDSHDSESERYIYFSSTFAVMLLAVVLTMVIKNKVILVAAVATLTILYALSLFKTINHYKEGGVFANKYLTILNNNKPGKKTIYIINQPSQYYGALLFRAKSRMAGNTKNSVTILNEFIDYLYPGNKSFYITLSIKDFSVPPLTLRIYHTTMDSVNVYFPSAKINLNDTVIVTQKGEIFPFIKSTSAIVALKDADLFIFE